MQEADIVDTELSIQALVDVTQGPEPTLVKVWERKAELITERLGVSNV
jgi:hypothetical protein